MPGSRAVLVRSGRHPHEIALLVMSVVLGIVGILVSGSTSPGISSAFPGHTENFFYVGLSVSGAVALYGALLRNITGLLVERAGLIGLSCIFLGYTIAVFTNAGVRGTTSALFGLAFTVANIVRLVQISRDMKLLHATLAEVNQEEPKT